MEIPLKRFIPGFIPGFALHSESANSKVVPISKGETSSPEKPIDPKPIDLSIFSNYRKILDHYGITPKVLFETICVNGVTKCLIGDEDKTDGNKTTVNIYWKSRAIAPPPEYYSSQNRSSIIRTD